jgi:carbon-monoxide dehydrogenase medium subunit
MKPAPFTYHDPATIAEAVALLARCENARPLAGGQSLLPMLNFRYAMPDHVIDLNRVAALAGIRVDPNLLAFGAMTRQRDIERDPRLAAACPILRTALLQVGHRQTRNRGTIGGSLCHLDPAAELVNLARLHDAHFTTVSVAGERTLNFSEFARGALTHGLREDEMLVQASFARWHARHGHGFEEVARRQGDFAIAIASALIELDDDERVRRAAICVSGVEPLPTRLNHAETLLVGQRISHELLRAAAIEGEKLDAMDDAYVGASYRKHLARVLTYRALERAAADACSKVATHA